MRRTSFILAVTIGFIIPASAAYAEPATYVSGPTGTQINGWYTGEVEVSTSYTPTCNSDPAFLYSMQLGKAVSKAEGTNHFRILSDANGDLRAYRGTTQINDYDQYCGIHSAGGPGPFDSVIWEGDLRTDFSPPTVTVSESRYPATTDDTQVVTGTVTDVGSGVERITVNGNIANVNGNSYSATVPIDLGDNTLSIVATDQVGKSDTASAVVFRRDLTVSEALSQTTGSHQTAATASATPSPSSTPMVSEEPTPIPTDTGTPVATVSHTSKTTTTVVWSVMIFLSLAGIGYGFGRGWLKKTILRR